MKPQPIQKFRISVIEDDLWYGQLLQYHLSQNPDYEVALYASGKEFFSGVRERPDLVTIDFSLPDISGDQLLRKIAQLYPGLPVIVISAQSKIGTVVELLKLGAIDYLVKDEHTRQSLWNAVRVVRENAALNQPAAAPALAPADAHGFSTLLKGNSPAIQRTFDMMARAAQTPVNVSINGETGTGKELVANGIHLHSERRKGPFVAVNMAAIPSELVESELFGHEKGAFTGAIGRKIGKFEEANQGTLFLDEIGELSPVIQSKLLRVLQEREMQRVGGNDKIKLNVRLVTATHKNLAEEVSKGTFREDLYFRIMGLPIVLPPLRERGPDIVVLAQHFLEAFCHEYQKPPLLLSAAAQAKLVAYDYPGNVRELKTVLELAAVLSNGHEIRPVDLLFTPPTKSKDFLSEEKTLREYTRTIIRYHLDKYSNNVPLIAEKLGIGRSTIYKLVQDGEV
ncbi:sigma-54-dependent response regulator transcription factor ZraR [Hymenobacter glaciei]|uniref:Sigma-54-dependent response regulator transcription factor ZraR n=1 Tax=Hymenobacter glaciei TaxID=877209 RepID=A0ABP7U4K8_9BACT